MAKESLLEHKFVTEVKKAGGLALKFVSPGFIGVPDRLVLIALGHIAFVEVKAPNKKPRKIQSRRHKQIEQLGFKVYVLDDESKIGGIIDEIRAT